MLAGAVVTRTETYFHDDLGRLRVVTSSDPARNQTFDFDILGNITANSLVGTLTRADPAHVHAITDTSTGDHYDYDPAGRMIRSPTLDIGSSADSYPERIDDRRTGTSQRFAYDSDWPCRKTIWASRHDCSPDETIDIDASGNVTFWVLAEGRRIASWENGRTTFLHADALGSIRLATNAAGAVTAVSDYGVWGDRVVAGAGGTQRGFIGGLSIGLSGLVKLGARFYDPDGAVHLARYTRSVCLRAAIAQSLSLCAERSCDVGRSERPRSGRVSFVGWHTRAGPYGRRNRMASLSAE